MARRNKSKGRGIGLAFLTLVGIGMLIAILLRGTDVALLNPKGMIAGEQRQLMIRSVLVMLVVAVPTLGFLYFTAWKYRESNKKAAYKHPAGSNKALVLFIWTIPITVLLVLASTMWPATHRLAPQKSIEANAETLEIQVIAMRWKWLFIYPDQGIATINFVHVPVDTPVQFELTADEAPMSSFWIPHWSGQLYAMTGHVNHLNILVAKPGDSVGSSAEINGAGFAGMKFIARASSNEDFEEWVNDVQASYGVLDTSEYEKLLTPSQNNPATFYADVDTGLYDKTLMKYNGSHNMHTEQE